MLPTSSVASSTLNRVSAHALSFSSASSTSSPFSGASHIDHRGFLKSSRRTGVPVLTSPPTWTTENTFTDSPAQIHNRARKILDDLEIKFSVVIMKGCTSKVDPKPMLQPAPGLASYTPGQKTIISKHYARIDQIPIYIVHGMTAYANSHRSCPYARPPAAWSLV